MVDILKEAGLCAGMEGLFKMNKKDGFRLLLVVPGPILMMTDRPLPSIARMVPKPLPKKLPQKSLRPNFSPKTPLPTWPN
jgi:hypothetical protein